jgi:hypothetical protein
MRHEELGCISRSAATVELESGDRDRISRTLVQLALHDPERAWLEGLLVRFMSHDDSWIRGVAALCVGHVARLHRSVDRAVVGPALERLLRDPETAGRAEDALDDIEAYVDRTTTR